MRNTLLAVSALLGASWLTGACVPINNGPSPQPFLLQAQQAAQAQDTAATLASLDGARNAFAQRRTPVGRPETYPHLDPAIRAIAEADIAVRQHRWDDARYYINTALHDPSVL